MTVTKDGYHRLPASESADYAQQVVDGRMTLPAGPPAPLRLVSLADLWLVVSVVARRAPTGAAKAGGRALTPGPWRRRRRA